MRKSRFTDTQKRAILAEYQGGIALAELTRKHQISAATFYKWQQSFEQERTREGRRLKELEAENARLKKMYAELSIDHQILKEGYALVKKDAAQDAKRNTSI